MRKIKYKDFTSKSSITVPAMTVRVMIDGKQVEQFDVPPGFQLDRYVQSEYPKEATLIMRWQRRPFEAFVIQVYKHTGKTLLTNEEIARKCLAVPDIEFVGEFHETVNSFSMMNVKIKMLKDAVEPSKETAIDKFETDDDDDSYGGHA